MFGLRTDNSARGGDIDLLVESELVIDQPALVGARLGARLQQALGDQRIDVVIAAPNVPDQASTASRGLPVARCDLAPAPHIRGTAASSVRV